MHGMRVITLSILCLCLVGLADRAPAQTIVPPAEKANYQGRGTLYGPMMEYISQLSAHSSLVQVQKLTETLLGRDMVLVTLSDPPVFKPSDAAALNRPIVLIANNVHGGEYAGKDASLALMRDLALGDLKPLLSKVVVLVIPTMNPDGAEVYRRTNEQGFDLNRDYLKMESQEVHALVTRVLNTWQPDIHVDTHHGGSAPYTLTYQTCLNPACDPDLVALANDRIVPRIRKALRQEDYDGFWYSGPSRLDKVDGWSPTSCEPRKQHTYSGLGNIVGFLFETPGGSHRITKNGTQVVAVDAAERYRHQVRGQYLGQRELIRFAAEETALLEQTVARAKLRATELGDNDADQDPIVLEYRQESRGNEEVWRAKGWGAQRPGGAPPGPPPPAAAGPRAVEYEKVTLPIFTRFTPTRTTVRPWGYLLPPNLATVVPLLLDHDISVKRLTAPIEVEVEVYYATEVKDAEYFQGHYLKRAKVEKKVERVKLPAGTFLVPSGQPRSNLISYLLEPETDDSLLTWNYLDNYVRAVNPAVQERTEDGTARPPRPATAQRIPIYRLLKRTGLQGVVAEEYNQIQKNRFVR